MLSESRTLAHAGLLDVKVRAQIDAERDRLLEGSGRDSLLKVPRGVPHNEDARTSDPVAVAIGSMHLEHVWTNDGPNAPYASTEQITRPDDADLTRVRTNLDHAAASTVSDRSGWACQTLAEVAALELAARPDFVSLKSILLQKLLGERPLRRALTESARRHLAEGQSA